MCVCLGGGEEWGACVFLGIHHICVHPRNWQTLFNGMCMINVNEYPELVISKKHTGAAGTTVRDVNCPG